MNPSSEFQIQDWLGRLGLAELAPIFERNDITRETLAELTNEDLKECGISSLGQRKKLLAAIRELDALPEEPAAASVLSPAPEVPPPGPRIPAEAIAAGPIPLAVPVRSSADGLPVAAGVLLSEELHRSHDAQEAAIRRQQRLSLITSMIVALLSIILIMAILALFVLPALLVESPQVVVYESSPTEQDPVETRKVVARTQDKPSRPASSVAQVIAANVSSPTAVPVPDIAVSTPSLEFGDSEDFGQGWGDTDGSANGSGMSFFGMKKTSRSAVFVFDISGSMVVKPRSPKTYRALEEEIIHSISMLSSDSTFGLVAFSKGARAFKSSMVAATLGERNAAGQWLKSMSPIPGNQGGNTFEKYKGGRHSGTRADLALEAAMKLRPEMIIFVSDGEPTDAKGKSSRSYEREVLKKVAAMQKNQPRPVQINAVAYMTGAGIGFMRELAKQNDGDFREVRPKDLK